MIARKKTTQHKNETLPEFLSRKATRWVGSVESLIFHTTAFAVSFSLYFFGVSFTTILLVVTTIVSLEAIYLSIFVQMTLNKHTDELSDIQEDVGEIQEDVGEIQENVEEIQEDVEEIQEDVDEIQEDVDEIQENVEDISEEDNAKEHRRENVDPAMLERIEFALKELGKEISEMKRRGVK